MPHIKVKNLRRTDAELVYQGPAVLEALSTVDETEVQLWGSDSAHQQGAFGVFLSADEARALAKQLLQHAAIVESNAAGL